jgi:hypothetical protein
MKKIFFAAAIVFISSCASNEIGHSKDVNQDEIHQGYSVSYDEEKNETDIHVFFRFAGPNGTTLILDEPSKVEMDGTPLQKDENTGVGCYYFKKVNGNLPDKEYVFTFTDINGKKFENKLNFRNMMAEELPKEISKKEGLTIHFTDKPEGRNEDLTVEIFDDSTEVNEIWKHVFFERVKFPKEKLDKLHGNISVRIRRNGYTELKQHAHAGGFISTEYVLAPRTLKITD